MYATIVLQYMMCKTEGVWRVCRTLHATEAPENICLILNLPPVISRCLAFVYCSEKVVLALSFAHPGV